MEESIFVYRGAFQASGDLCTRPRLTLSPDVLALSGIIIDTISAKVISFSPLTTSFLHGNEVETHNIAIQAEKDCFAFIQQLPSWYHPTGEPLQLAYRKTLVCDYVKNAPDNLNIDIDFAYNEWLSALRDPRPYGLRGPKKDRGPLYPQMKKRKDAAQVYGSAAKHAVLGRNFCVTEKGYMGLTPARAKVGDLLCILLGGVAPFVIRPVENGKFELIGNAYIHGVMNGEAIAVLGKDVEEKIQDICLV
jgi:hypothetical protein